MCYVTGNVRGLVARKKLAQDKADKALTMLKGVLDYTEFKDVDMVIEVCQVSSLRMRYDFLKFFSLLRICQLHFDRKNGILHWSLP